MLNSGIRITLHGVICVQLLKWKVKPALTQLLVGFKSPLPFLEEPRRCFFRCLLVRRHLDLNGFLHDITNPSVKSNSSQLMISHSIMKMKRRLEFIALSFVNDSREQAIFYRCVCLLMWIVFSSLYVNAKLQ